MSFVIAIVGRPNVGKSRLFNRLVKGDEAIVHGEPGVTRDRQYGRGHYDGEPYTVIDTGGLVLGTDDNLMDRMHDQAQIAMEEADAIIFMLDGRAGVMPGDREIAEKLRLSEKPTFFAVNKVDRGTNRDELLAEFYQLGVDLYAVSAEHDIGIRELMEDVMALREEEEAVEAAEEKPYVRCAVVGKPNAGKSTLVNRILGQDRIITSDTPGTTRDSIDTLFEREGREYLLIDTAGLRRKSNISEQLEELSVVQAIKSIDRADVALIVIEAPEGVTRQDKKIASVVERRGCACVILVNKWDLLDRREETGDMYRDYLREELGFLDWAPVIFISALTGRKTNRILDTIDHVERNYERRISTSTLNDFIEATVARHSPPLHKDRQVKIYYGTQVSTRPPTFVMFTNYPEGIEESYKRYLENRLREEFDFEGTPIRIYIRERD